MHSNLRAVIAAVALFVLAVLAAPNTRLAAAAESDIPEEQEPRQMRGPDAVFVGTPYDAVSAMLQMADIKKQTWFTTSAAVMGVCSCWPRRNTARVG